MVEIREINVKEVDYALLLLADPDIDAINQYIKHSQVFQMTDGNTPIGCLVLEKISGEIVEFKNIAIYENFQNQGYGSKMLAFGIGKARELNFKTAVIGTGNSSIAQLYLYQKAGFEIDSIRKDFFTDNYAEAITENGIQCKHMLVLKMEL